MAFLDPEQKMAFPDPEQKMQFHNAIGKMALSDSVWTFKCCTHIERQKKTIEERQHLKIKFKK